jgi:hypothetical protein
VIVGNRGQAPLAIVMRAGRIFVAVALLAMYPFSADAERNIEPLAPKRVVALRIAEPVIVDGHLDEAAWQAAQPASDFTQQQPDEGCLTTEPSEVRFLYDERYLYIGGTFYDTEPLRGPIVNELRRDFSERDGDLIQVVLDTFHDKRTASTFMTNPAGALGDTQSYDDGRQQNRNWDAVWIVRTARFDHGWTMEMAIPFKSLRFRRLDVQQWGLNLLRLIRRKNEITLWSPIPRQFSALRVSYAGVLEGLEGVRPSFNLRVKPFAIAQVARGGSLRPEWNASSNGGFDLKYGVGTGLTLDASYRTDFSQVEADDQQINLSRSGLFFPEKREFFLENQGAFKIGDQSTTAEGGRHDLVPFFSRRIGLSVDEELIPLLGGLRLSGIEGAYGLGIMQMWTDRTAKQPSTSYTAARLTRGFANGATIGGFFFGTVSGSYANQVGGADVHLTAGRTKDLDFFIVRSNTSTTGGGWAGRAAVSVNEDGYTANMSYTHVGAHYQNGMGFVQRPDISLLSWEYERNLRPRRTDGLIRNHTLGGEGDFFGDSRHEQLVTRVARVDYSAEFADGGRFAVDLDWNTEQLSEPFEIQPGFILTPGEYRFNQIITSYTSDRSRWISGNARLTVGEFWSGRITGVDTGARIRVNERLAGSFEWSANRASLPQGRLETTLASLRLDYSFSTRMFVSALVQYNSTTRALLSNVRFNVIHRPLSDVYVVFNRASGNALTDTDALIIKYTHLLAF